MDESSQGGLYERGDVTYGSTTVLTAPKRDFRSSARTGHHHVGQSPDLGVCSPSLAGELKPSKVAASSILQIGMAGEQ